MACGTCPDRPLPRAGHLRDEVREALHGVGLDACGELITWFGWHDGTVGNVGLGHETEEIVPGVFFPPLKECLRLHAQARSMVDDLARADLDAGTYYPAGSFPITRHLRPYMDVVSCDPPHQGTWFVPWDGEAEANGPHLADLVERVAARWKAGITR